MTGVHIWWLTVLGIPSVLIGTQVSLGPLCSLSAHHAGLLTECHAPSLTWSLDVSPFFFFLKSRTFLLFAYLSPPLLPPKLLSWSLFLKLCPAPQPLFISYIFATLFSWQRPAFEVTHVFLHLLAYYLVPRPKGRDLICLVHCPV